jgi:phosphoadenosine phosphosulfate reductase
MALIQAALADPELGRHTVLVSSFGADSVVVLHMVATIAPDLPVIFLDTEKHFDETIRYREHLTRRLRLTDVRVVRPDRSETARIDPAGDLFAHDPDRCCELRKARPLEQALAGTLAWITGRKRYQTPWRAALPTVEFETRSGRIKLNPLASWSAADVQAYIELHDLPPHPLVSQGFPSIGCATCTQPVSGDEAPRSGRWWGSSRTECGIHAYPGSPQGDPTFSSAPDPGRGAKHPPLRGERS